MDYKKELKNWVKGGEDYNHLMNTFINDHTEDWYVKIGKYIVDAYGGKAPKGVIFRKRDGEREYSWVSMMFLTGLLDIESMTTMFGHGLLHNEFGEGFDGEYDEETDTESEPLIKEQHISWFIELDSVKFHIGIDHRGTSICVNDMFISPQKLYNCITKLVDLYKEKV